ncbi:MAG: FecR domain-containing protein [Phycisphaeraceae bacterium]
MNDDAPVMAELEVLLAVLADGTLSADQRARLNAILSDHPQAQQFYKQYIELHVMLEWEAGVAIEEASDDSAVLLELLQAERQAESIVVTQPELQTQPIVTKADRLTWQEVGSATAYLLNKPKVWGSFAGAIAAVLAVAVLLFVVFRPGTPPVPIANNTIESVTPQQTPVAPVAPVAVLTNTHDAQWVQQPTENLYPGDRLTLTAGFAEITTAQGAIVILEAPATIELIEHNNALRLHAGKLVGICETESSKGFLVRTPHLDVTDLGTRFGVDATQADSTQVHVMQGEVLVARPGNSDVAEPKRLIAGQSARAEQGQPITASKTYDPGRFSRLLPTTHPLANTGQGIQAGQVDPNWQVIAIDGKSLDHPRALRVGTDRHYSKYVACDPMTSQFVTWNPGIEPAIGKSIAYTFRTRITLPDTIDLTDRRLDIRFMADNALTAVVINGNQIEVRDGVFDVAYDRWVELVIVDNLVVGENTILFEIDNRRINQASTSKVGLRISWELNSPQSVFLENETTP